jgi:hypothetical protein
MWYNWWWWMEQWKWRKWTDWITTFICTRQVHAYIQSYVGVTPLSLKWRSSYRQLGVTTVVHAYIIIISSGASRTLKGSSRTTLLSPLNRFAPRNRCEILLISPQMNKLSYTKCAKANNAHAPIPIFGKKMWLSAPLPALVLLKITWIYHITDHYVQPLR